MLLGRVLLRERRSNTRHIELIATELSEVAPEINDQADSYQRRRSAMCARKDGKTNPVKVILTGICTENDDSTKPEAGECNQSNISTVSSDNAQNDYDEAYRDCSKARRTTVKSPQHPSVARYLTRKLGKRDRKHLHHMLLRSSKLAWRRRRSNWRGVLQMVKFPANW